MKFFSRFFLTAVGIYSITGQVYSQTKALPQKSIITTKTVVLKFEKQTDTLRIPVVDDKYPALKQALSDKNIFDGDDLPDIIKNYELCGCGVTNLYYYVTFESKDILSIVMYFETVNAYPDDHQKYLTYNINTGELYPITKEITPQGINWIYDTYKTTMRKRISEGKDENEEATDEVYNVLKTAIDGLKIEELFDNYIFIKDGITFSTDKILPHADQAQEPNHDLHITFKKLKAFKNPNAVILK